jgi:hypothetical protein
MQCAIVGAKLACGKRMCGREACSEWWFGAWVVERAGRQCRFDLRNHGKCQSEPIRD